MTSCCFLAPLKFLTLDFGVPNTGPLKFPAQWQCRVLLWGRVNQWNSIPFHRGRTEASGMQQWSQGNCSKLTKGTAVKGSTASCWLHTHWPLCAPGSAMPCVRDVYRSCECCENWWGNSLDRCLEEKTDQTADDHWEVREFSIFLCRRLCSE